MDLLDSAYNRDDYLHFLADKFNFSKNLVPTQHNNNEVESFEQLGFVTTHDDKQLPVYEIHIKPNTRLSRNRVQLRNLVAKQIKTEEGALAVYIDGQNQQWRFSFISIEWTLTENGLETQQTASKRFTYILGENANTRTAKERFGKVNQQSTLENLKQAFAVETLNKEFYGKLYKWYERAQKQVVFPNDEGAENHEETSLIRLLTRLLFIWFIKEKKLINPDLFDLDKLKNLIDYDEPSSFYKAILQNLFFATLNVEISKRIFRDSKRFKGANEDYGNQYRYRYHKLVKNEKKWKELFSQTPFLNGGLFESLDRKLEQHLKDDKGNKIINAQDKSLIDNWDKNARPERNMLRAEGFSEHPDNPLSLENSLFFNANDSGLIDLFKQYQFTIEESTPLDIEVALDPELLGKVFENLLASYNPETGEQARKATGSFYTPREIVNYMVDESLKQYFKQHKNLDESQINDLFIEKDTTLDERKIKTIITAIDALKILDPAVGSGAYPMGILQRLVFILEKIDPENTHFKQQQIEKTESMDEASKKASIEAIEKVFDQANQHNAYGKKLMLIENCIYGADIQSIAIQISKLRFFISLTIEQNRNDNKNDNYGIKALPNLETKFIAANTLLPLRKIEVGKRKYLKGMFDTGIKELQEQLAKVRHKHFSAKTLDNKRNHREKDKELREQMKKMLAEQPVALTPEILANMQKVVDWDLYNQNSVSDWFDPEWQFGVKDGFDIVIGNPPYAKVKRKIYPHDNFPYSEGKDKGKQNLYKLFTEQSYNLCKTDGVATMIVQSSLMGDLSATGTRQLLLDKTQLKHIIEFPKTAKSRENQVFNSVTQGTCIYQLVKRSSDNFTIDISINNDRESIKKLIFSPIEKQTIQGLYPTSPCFPKIATGYAAILQKIVNNASIKPFLTFIKSLQQGDINLTTYSSSFSNKLTPVKLMRGKHVGRYKIKYEMADEYMITGFKPDKVQSNQENCFLISQEVTGTNDIRRLHFAVKNNEHEQVLWGHSVNKTLLKNQEENPYFLALLNSRFMDWYFRITSSNNHVQGYEIEQLPIPQISKPDQQPFIDLVNKILPAKQAGTDTTALETKIDQMVYKLYNLTADEIAIIEAKK